MVFARTAMAQKHLEQQFRKHSTGRRYLAIVHGHVKEQTIQSRLVRDRGDGIRGSTNLPETGKLSITHVRPIEKLGKYSLIECRPETGRTHQIRIHLAEIGHPLCGEKIYLQPLFRQAIKDTSGVPRLALHAKELSFQHPITGETMHFESASPTELMNFIRDKKSADKANKHR
jgi:23S rRNA pseudouridine1911/1915/1917 synthase